MWKKSISFLEKSIKSSGYVWAYPIINIKISRDLKSYYCNRIVFMSCVSYGTLKYIESNIVEGELTDFNFLFLFIINVFCLLWIEAFVIRCQ